MIQTEPDVTDADVAAIRTVAEQYGLEVNDRRGQRTSVLTRLLWLASMRFWAF